MDKQYISETKMLNFNDKSLQELIQTRKWLNLDMYNRIKAIYEFVQNEILFGYNKSDTLSASQVLNDGYGQCNTKATLLIALLRACNVPSRIHGFEVSKDFQKGATNSLISILAPDTILHTWAEVYYNDEWLALEGVITDKKYFDSVKKTYINIENKFEYYAIATNDFKNISIDWNGNSTYVQSTAIVKDLGTYPSPDIFFEEYSQHWSKLKDLMYVIIARKIMNYNVSKMRNKYK